MAAICILYIFGDFNTLQLIWQVFMNSICLSAAWFFWEHKRNLKKEKIIFFCNNYQVLQNKLDDFFPLMIFQFDTPCWKHGIIKKITYSVPKLK